VRKVLVLLLLICMISGTGTGFAMQEPREPVELDSRITILRSISESGPFESMAGDVKFLQDGNIAIQEMKEEVEVSSGGSIKIVKLSMKGNELESVEIPFEMAEIDGPGFSFLVEDADGNLFTTNLWDLFMIEPEFEEAVVVDGFVPFWCDVESMDRVMINMIRDFRFDGPMSFGVDVIGTLTYGEDEFPADFDHVDYIDADDLTTSAGSVEAITLGADFGNSSEELYILYLDFSAEEIWKVAKFNVSYEMHDEWLDVDYEFVENITLEGLNDDQLAVTFEFDGEYFQVPTIGFREGSVTTVRRFNMEGQEVDSVMIPGQCAQFDTKGDYTVISSMGSYEESAVYLIEWVKSNGSPNKLIQERTMGGKTTATFRDGGYGLLRSEDPETGMIDYLAPLRTEEKEVRLRMPLCDVMAKVGGAAQNLEILYGEDRIQIPMTALAVQDLLAQMPCDTDATVEIQLVRGQDGIVTVTAELFVVEQVDSMTKVVHRMPIPLP